MQLTDVARVRESFSRILDFFRSKGNFNSCDPQKHINGTGTADQGAWCCHPNVSMLRNKLRASAA